ncbi:hypothetical protein GQX74_010591 [Glossina fuscipes]|nr:hypothetical protein GQX74_010591 [Glossina fuscipes]
MKIMALNTQTALKTMTSFNGSFNDLEPFRKVVILLAKNLNDDGETQLLEFIAHTKLSQNVKMAIRSVQIPATLQYLYHKPRSNFKTSQTIRSIQNTLTNIYQKDKIQNYDGKIVTLIGPLNNL